MKPTHAQLVNLLREIVGPSPHELPDLIAQAREVLRLIDPTVASPAPAPQPAEQIEIDVLDDTPSDPTFAAPAPVKPPEIRFGDVVTWQAAPVQERVKEIVCEGTTYEGRMTLKEWREHLAKKSTILKVERDGVVIWPMEPPYQVSRGRVAVDTAGMSEADAAAEIARAVAEHAGKEQQ